MRGFTAGGTTEYRTAITRSRDGEEMEGGFRGFTAGGTTEYRTATTRSRDGEEMEGGFRQATMAVLINRETTISIEKPTAPGSCCHVDTSSAAQEGPVVQGFADGQAAIVCHYCEERILCCDQEKEEKDLSSTSCIGDGLGVPQRVGHGFGDSGGDGAQVKNREVEEEEVHGGVEAVVAGYGSDDEAVAQEGSQVDAQEEPEVQELQLPCVCKCQEEELGDGADVGHLLPLGMRGFTVGGTTAYGIDTTTSRDGEEMEGGFRGDPQHSPEDLHIGQHNVNKASKIKKNAKHKQPNFPDVGTSEKPTAPGSCNHFETSSAAQEGPVEQRFADGQITIGICHGFGDSGGDGAQVEEGEVEEEEVHGAVEAVVAGYGGDDEAVAQEGSQVDAQEEPEVQELQLPRVCKCQEEELGGGAAVGHLFTLSKGPGQGGKGSDKEPENKSSSTREGWGNPEKCPSACAKGSRARTDRQALGRVSSAAEEATPALEALTLRAEALLGVSVIRPKLKEPSPFLTTTTSTAGNWKHFYTRLPAVAHSTQGHRDPARKDSPGHPCLHTRLHTPAVVPGRRQRSCPVPLTVQQGSPAPEDVLILCTRETRSCSWAELSLCSAARLPGAPSMPGAQPSSAAEDQPKAALSLPPLGSLHVSLGLQGLTSPEGQQGLSWGAPAGKWEMERGSAAAIPVWLGLLLTLPSMATAGSPHGPRAPQPPRSAEQHCQLRAPWGVCVRE
ncbi:hypothetical protein QYF61_000164 [Mycteria americana]|uniref:Uncharacterized protein n=1 Tax=Mycteria americana TaxID=33587 RepID=A0AAN7MGQ2_MYCAM|nr:hypothetical protein QYF61_000164 [Mycteria americana]